MDRRQFLPAALLGALGLPTLLKAANPHLAPKTLAPGMTLLMQGDSITDAGRNRGRYYANDPAGMGHGYALHLVTRLMGQHPDLKLRCYNRGISGNKVYQLANRWEDDCLQLQPDIISILIGVNDFWHTLTSGYKGTAKTYANDLRALLARTKAKLPKARLIMAEPFVVKGGSAIDNAAWFPAFSVYQKANKAIAAEFDAAFIPLQSIFDKALESAPVSYWCPDGVHPSMAGAYLMAAAWEEALRL